MRVPGHDGTGLQRVAIAHIGGKTAGLAHQQKPGADVPRLDPKLPRYPSNRPCATHARSSAAEPNRRIPATCGINTASVRLNARCRGADTAANGIPVANTASFISRRADTRRRRSFTNAPVPFSAQNISSTAGA